MKIQIGQAICGICEQPGATKSWHNQRSYHVHSICLQWFQRENNALQSLLDELLPDGHLPYRNLAQSTALNVLKHKIGNATLLTFKRSPRGDDLLAHLASQDVRDAILDIKEQTKTRYYHQNYGQ